MHGRMYTPRPASESSSTSHRYERVSYTLSSRIVYGFAFDFAFRRCKGAKDESVRKVRLYYRHGENLSSAQRRADSAQASAVVKFS